VRITVLILGFTLGAVMFAQTFLIYGLSNITDDTDSGRAASAGIGMVVLWLFAVAFVFGIPWLSVGLFLIAGAVGFANAEHFPDLQVWGVASLILAGLSVISLRQARDKESRFPVTVAAAVTAERDLCPSCGVLVVPGTRYCSSCGQSLESLTCPSCTRPVALNDAFCALAERTCREADMSIPESNLRKLKSRRKPQVRVCHWVSWCVYFWKCKSQAGLAQQGHLIGGIILGSCLSLAF
jgi:Double zinc ribbon